MQTADTEVRLVELARRLSEANQGVMRGLQDSDWPLFLASSRQFSELRKQINGLLLASPAVTIHQPAARETIRKVSLDEPFPADKISSKVASLCAGGAIENRDVCALPDEEIDDLADLLSPQYNHAAYVRNLYEIGCLILGIPVPKTLLAFVAAARDSYAFENYLAVLSLCRSMLEVALRDMAERKHMLDRDPMAPPPLPAPIRKKITPPALRDPVEELYRRTSLLIHGRASTDREEARQVFRRTLEMIQGTYKYYGLE